MTEIDRLLELEKLKNELIHLEYKVARDLVNEYHSLKDKAETAIKLQVIVKECIGNFNDKNTSISLILSEHLQMMVRASEE